MEVLKTKAVRFVLVVEECGSPAVRTVWQAPEKDPKLKKQIAQNHVMTLQRSSTGTDFGCVGFIERKGAFYLVFPKSLKRFADQRIVGIKWELVKK